MNIFYQSLLLAPNRIIAHGVNCMGAFGSGLAYQIAITHPEVKKFYLKKYHEEGWALGDIQMVACDSEEYCKSGRIVVNMATQNTYGRSGQHVSYDAIEQCLDKLFKICKEFGHVPALPQIGCGLGGGDWNVVSKIIECKVLQYDVGVDVYITRR